MRAANINFKEEPKRDTKTRILEAASILFWEKSFDAVGTDAICKAANVQKGSLYHFFGSKEELAVEIIGNHTKIMDEKFLKPTFSSELTPLKQIEKYAETLSNLATECYEQTGIFYGCPLLNIAAELSVQSDNIRKALQKAFTIQWSYIKEALDNAQKQNEIADTVNTKNTAHSLLATLHGSILMAKTAQHPSLIKQTVATTLKNLHS